MYHAIVRARIRRLLAGVDRGRTRPPLGHRPNHGFAGNHALSGPHVTQAQARDWYARMQRLFPQISFDPQRIDVAGGPWNTIAVVECRHADPATPIIGVHVVTLRWGRVTGLLILRDAAGLRDGLSRGANTTGRAMPPLNAGRRFSA